MVDETIQVRHLIEPAEELLARSRVSAGRSDRADGRTGAAELRIVSAHPQRRPSQAARRRPGALAAAG